MANINHEDIGDPYRHEPKGASSAAHGAVYVSDGAGSGSWVKRIYTATITPVAPGYINDGGTYNFTVTGALSGDIVIYANCACSNGGASFSSFVVTGSNIVRGTYSSGDPGNATDPGTVTLTVVCFRDS